MSFRDKTTLAHAEILLEMGLNYFGLAPTQDVTTCWRQVLLLEAGHTQALEYLASAQPGLNSKSVLNAEPSATAKVLAFHSPGPTEPEHSLVNPEHRPPEAVHGSEAQTKLLPLVEQEDFEQLDKEPCKLRWAGARCTPKHCSTDVWSFGVTIIASSMIWNA